VERRWILGLLALALVGVPACGGEAAAPAGSTAAPRRVGDAGATVALPTGWHATAADDGIITDPVTRIVAASAPIRPTESACQIAAYAFPDDAVALVVVEWATLDGSLPDRPERFTARELPILPPPSVECFGGPAGTVQFVEHGRAFGAYLLAGTRAGDALVEEARRVLETFRATDADPPPVETLSRGGVSIGVPDGWDGRILFRDPAGATGLVFQVASFELPANEGFEPPPELPPGEEDPIKAMGGGDVLVTVVTDATRGSPSSGSITLADLELLPPDAPRVPRDHTLAEGSLCTGGRCLGIAVDFGGRPPRSALEQRVNEVLGSLTVTPADATSFADSQSHLSGRLPAGWHAVEAELTAVVYPRQALVLASFPLRQHEPDPECIPATALEQLPADGAAIVVLEYTGEPEPLQADFPARPDRFRLDDETRAHYECYGLGYAIRFRDGGRQLQAQVLLGEQANAERLREVEEILDDLTVGPQ